MRQAKKQDYQITTVRLPPGMKKQVRILAAENETSMVDMTERLISLGMAAYNKGLLPESIQAQPADTAA